MWFDSLRIYTALSIRKSKDKSVFSGTPGYYCRHGKKRTEAYQTLLQEDRETSMTSSGRADTFIQFKTLFNTLFFNSSGMSFYFIEWELFSQLPNWRCISITADKQLFSVLSLSILKQVDSVSRWIKLSEKQKLLCNKIFYSTSVLLCLWY